MRIFSSTNRSPWAWIPSLYFAEGLPYVIVMSVAVLMYKRLGLSNTDIALYTSWLYLPWVIKPLWSPIVEVIKTKRWWIVSMQLLIGAGMAGVAFTIPGSNFLQGSLCFFWLMAFSSATHDIAADGFYMFGLKEYQQAYFLGIRTTFYRIAMITGQGLLVIFAGILEKQTGSITMAWSLTFYLLAAIFAGLFAWHSFILPNPEENQAAKEKVNLNSIFSGFIKTFSSFFSKKNIISALIFILVYRLAEAQLVKLASPFLLDSREAGGLELSTGEVGFAYGTVGIIALVIGGILSGVFASRMGLKKSLLWMLLALNLPDLVYVYMAYARPESLWVINGLVGLEQLGYGFGFTGFSLFLIYFSEGSFKTAHYALCTAFMALGMMLPGMAAGWLQEIMGYQHFFIWVMICTLPAFCILPFMKIDSDFGKKPKNG